jgi:hypothetical protein
MDQHRELAMYEHLDRLTAEEVRGDAAATMRCHDDQVARIRRRGIDDRPVGMLVFDMDELAADGRR